MVSKALITYSPSMEVLRHTHYQCFVLRDTFHLVAPFPCNLDSGLNRFRSRVHRQDHVEIKEAGDKLGKPREDIVVEGPRTEGQPRRLFGQRLDQFWMAMALIHRTIR